MTIRAIAADTFEDAPVDSENPKVVTRDGWQIMFDHAGEWYVEARKDGAILDMHMSADWSAHDVAQYVTKEIRGHEDNRERAELARQERDERASRGDQRRAAKADR
jgi:hypothetical protein